MPALRRADTDVDSHAQHPSPRINRITVGSVPRCAASLIEKSTAEATHYERPLYWGGQQNFGPEKQRISAPPIIRMAKRHGNRGGQQRQEGEPWIARDPPQSERACGPDQESEPSSGIEHNYHSEHDPYIGDCGTNLRIQAKLHRDRSFPLAQFQTQRSTSTYRSTTTGHRIMT